MKCTKCMHYSYSLRRCKLGKIRPATIKGGVDAARFMGLSYLCSIDQENVAIVQKVAAKLKN